jgi:hypothetical protein
MKKLLIVIAVLMGVVNSTTLKAQVKSDTLEYMVIKPIDSAYVVSDIFLENPILYAHANGDEWAKTRLMYSDYQTFNNVWDYHKKFKKQFYIGAGIGGLAIASFVKTMNMPTPIRQVNNPALDPAADEAQRKRRVWGITSIVLGTTSSIIIIDSFKWQKRISAEVGLQSLRLEYNITGNRKYFNKV